MTTRKHDRLLRNHVNEKHMQSKKLEPQNSVFDSRTTSPFIIYLATSFATVVLIYVAAVWNTQWTDLFNSHPLRGEMGLGRFIIKGVRFNELGVKTPFAYPWRLATPTNAARLSTWLGYIVHQLGQFYILANVQWLSHTGHITAKWSAKYKWWNWQMLYLNVSMVAYKIIQGHVWYQGLAGDVPEGTAMGAVVAILIGAMIMEIPYRGLFFGQWKSLGIPHFQDIIAFVKRYHGYVMSFGIVYNFHYHPVEATVGHLLGFFYQLLLLWQSTSFLHNSHRNKNWTLLLEVWVLIHGSITAFTQPGYGWQIFLFGFSVLFLVNQIHGVPAIRNMSQSQRLSLLGGCYGAFLAMTYYGFQENKAYYRMTFIPVTEFLFCMFVLVVGSATASVVRKLRNLWMVALLTAVVYVLANTVLVYCLALILGRGQVRVYNDY